MPSYFSAQQTGTLTTYPSYHNLFHILFVVSVSAKKMSAEAETVTTNVRLPPDVWQLLFDELASRGDFSSLYSCAVSAKYLAGSGALANLYR